MVLGNCHRRRVWALLLRTIVLIKRFLGPEVYHGSWRENSPSGPGEYTLSGGTAHAPYFRNSSRDSQSWSSSPYCHRCRHGMISIHHHNNHYHPWGHLVGEGEEELEGK